MKKEILQVLAEKGAVDVKVLRDAVIKMLDSGEVDSTTRSTLKTDFKAATEALEGKGKIIRNAKSYSLNENYESRKRKRLNGDADVTLKHGSEAAAGTTSSNEGGEEKSKKKAKEAKDKTEDRSNVDAESGIKMDELWKNGEKFWREGSFPHSYLQNNPDKITRLFCGNLNKKVTEEQLRDMLPGITYIKWITDKQTGEFYGSSFLEMRDPESAAQAVLQDKRKFLGRPLKLYYCPPRPGDKWPPVAGQGGGSGSNNPPIREKTEKPPGCRKLFAGNLSYNIDDETMVDFFKDCGELIGLRWLTRQESGEFRGAGYVEFATTEEAEAAMNTLDNKELLGRNIRLDWTH